jgi:hypothetical protein
MMQEREKGGQASVQAQSLHITLDSIRGFEEELARYSKAADNLN